MSGPRRRTRAARRRSDEREHIKLVALDWFGRIVTIALFVLVVVALWRMYF